MKTLKVIFLMTVIGVVNIGFVSCIKSNLTIENGPPISVTQSIAPSESTDNLIQKFDAEYVNEYNEIMNVFLAVLQNEEKFYNKKNYSYNNKSEDEKYYYLKGYFEEFYVVAAMYELADMDGDSIPEVVISRASGDALLLRYYNSMIYGYGFQFRGLKSIKTDGTFSSSSGHADNSYGRLKFTEDLCENITLAHSDSSYDSDGNLSVSFYIGGEEVSETAFVSFCDEQEQKEGVEWYEFNEETIARDFAAAWESLLR